MEKNWLPEKFVKDLMVGRLSEQAPADSLLSYWLYRQTKILELEDTQAIQGHRDLKPCPAFFAQCFEEIKGKSALFSLDELLLIAEKYHLSIPGHLVQEIQTEAEQSPQRLRRYLSLMEHSYQDWGGLFPFAEAYHRYTKFESWNSLPQKQLKFSFLTTWLWKDRSDYKEWWSRLHAAARATCIEFCLYLKEPQMAAWAVAQKTDRSQKVQALLNAAQCIDKNGPLYGSLLKEVLKGSQPENLNWIAEAPEDWVLPIPDILEGMDFQFWSGIAWLDPADLFEHLEEGRKLTVAFAKHEQAEPMITALLHASLYHNNQRWTLYFMKLAHQLDLADLFAHTHWPSLAQRIPAAIMFKHIDQGFKTAQTDMHKLDYLQYWLVPSQHFVPKEFSVKLLLFLLNLVDYIGRNEILLQDNQGFLRFLSTHLHPSVVNEWPHTHYDADHLPSNRLKRRLNHRFKLYKALYEWQHQSS